MRGATFSAAWTLVLLGTHIAPLVEGVPEQTLQWVEAVGKNALCNDRTRAGFFISRNLNSSDPASSKWVIFLESGSLCFSNDTCNRRFFNPEVRTRYNAITPMDTPDFSPFGRFNPQVAWDDTVNNLNNPQPPVAVINPLMSSLKCYRNSTTHFPNGFQLTGTDILDRDPLKNKLFPSHNHVIIPYCSSDLWLGNETGGEECSCFNFTCNNFNPTSEGLGQFTFRGMRIFKSVFRQLTDDYGLRVATELVLAGSSVGGVGVVNNAKWVREQLGVGTELLVLFDSAWFVNFQDNVIRVLTGTSGEAYSAAQRRSPLFDDVLQSHPPCSDTSPGFPCCLSAHCLLTTSDDNGTLFYFPSGVRAFAISSIYDIFILAPSAQQVYDRSLQRQENAPPHSLGTTPSDDNDEDLGFDFVINFLGLMGEYGGAMNASLTVAAAQYPQLGFYVPQCAQHIYLATSTLWGDTGMSIFRDGGVALDFGTTATFSHAVSSGRWSNPSNLLAASPSTRSQIPLDRNLQAALLEWYSRTDISSPYQYRAHCQGPYCYDNPICPDMFVLTSLTSNSWPVGLKVVIAMLIVSISVVAVIMKVLFAVWLHQLEKKQDNFLDSLENFCEWNEGLEEFPTCPFEHWFTISCLDLCYSVISKTEKAESKDHTVPIVLGGIAESSDEEEGDNDPRRDTQSFEIFRRTSSESVGQEQGMIQTKKSSLTSSTSFQPSINDKTENKRFRSRYRKREILKEISLDLKPGDLTAIMGPSGCGKTTFLDLLTGRRRTGTLKGEIYVNGIPMENIRDWYVANLGYVLQSAKPYFEELTVRENITLAAQLKLSKRFNVREKLEKIEQVLNVTRLSRVADSLVGGTTGLALSGGHKKRLIVALQLLTLPSVIFLDEPTSGLDAAASFELLDSLNRLADSNRTVVITIHQPRLEIFHMFNKIVLLSEGKVAYNGVPEKCYEVFVNALTTSYLSQGLVIPELEDHNPADVIMDILGNPKMRHIIIKRYQSSDNPGLVRKDIFTARKKNYVGNVSSSQAILDMITDKNRFVKQPNLFTRMAVQEARGAKRSFVFFLPFIFCVFGFVLGTIYLQQTIPLLIVSGTSVFSMASGLFIFPAMYLYYLRALEVYTLERADGVGKAADLVLQGFIRFSSLFILPTVLSSTLFYLMLVNSQLYDAVVFFQFVLVNLALSQTWISLCIVLICASPNSASGVVAVAIAAFISGYFIPVQQLGWWWRWLVYINPNYYAVSSIAVLVLSDFRTSCIGSEFGCFLQSGTQVLRQFNFDKVNPYLHLIIMLVFTVVYLILAVLINWVRHNSLRKIIKIIISSKPTDPLVHDTYESPELSPGETVDRLSQDITENQAVSPEEPVDIEHSMESPVHIKVKKKWQSAARLVLHQHSERRSDDFATIETKYMEKVRSEGGLQKTSVGVSSTNKSTTDPPCQGPVDIEASPATSEAITPAERQCTSPEIMSGVELGERILADPSQSNDQGPPDTEDGFTSTTL